MKPLKELLRGLIPRQEVKTESPLYEQMKEVVDLANDFDKLQAFPAWERIVRHMGERVIDELTESTKYAYEPTRQVVHVTRWDAKRQLVDDLLGWIESTQRERDRIVLDFNEKREA